jgi:hypothetical protein
MANKEENSQAFTPEDIEKGLLDDFLKILFKIQHDGKYPLDIRIWTDGYCKIVNWVTVFADAPSTYQLLNGDQFIDEWISGEDKDGHTVSYRASDLEEDVFCKANGITYDEAKKEWHPVPKTVDDGE